MNCMEAGDQGQTLAEVDPKGRDCKSVDQPVPPVWFVPWGWGSPLSLIDAVNTLNLGKPLH